MDPKMKEALMSRYQGGGEGLEDSAGGGVVCEAMNCKNNKNGNCMGAPEIDANGTCLTKDEGNTPKEVFPGEKGSMPKGGAEE